MRLRLVFIVCIISNNNDNNNNVNTQQQTRSFWKNWFDAEDGYPVEERHPAFLDSPASCSGDKIKFVTEGTVIDIVNKMEVAILARVFDKIIKFRPKKEKKQRLQKIKTFL